jgi:hypothetical protein
MILDESLPQLVCPECMVALTTACKIKELCLESDAIFRQQYREDYYYEELDEVVKEEPVQHMHETIEMDMEDVMEEVDMHEERLEDEEDVDGHVERLDELEDPQEVYVEEVVDVKGQYHYYTDELHPIEPDGEQLFF